VKPPGFIFMPCSSLNLSGLLKQNTKFFFRQDAMLSSVTLQRYICMQW